MNLLVLLQGQDPADQLGYHTAFQAAVSQGELSSYGAYPYRGHGADWAGYWEDVTRYAYESACDVVFCQFFHDRSIPDPTAALARLRTLPTKPLIAVSCGDPFGPRHRPPPSLLQSARMSDIVFSSSMGWLADELVRNGARRVVLVPLGACDIRFSPEAVSQHPSTGDFDVVFVGNRPGGRNATDHLFWVGRRRAQAVAQLSRRFGPRFGLFGRGWDGVKGWQGPIPYVEQVAAYRRGSTIFGGYPGSKCDYYTSDRPFIAMTSGVPLVDISVPRVDRIIGPETGVALVNRRKDLVRSIENLLEADESQRLAMANSAQSAAFGGHMASHRVRTMVKFLQHLRFPDRNPNRPPLDFFTYGVKDADEAVTAIRGWS